jgi:hypothetical protein
MIKAPTLNCKIWLAGIAPSHTGVPLRCCFTASGPGQVWLSSTWGSLAKYPPQPLQDQVQCLFEAGSVEQCSVFLVVEAVGLRQPGRRLRTARAVSGKEIYWAFVIARPSSRSGRRARLSS